MTDSRKPLDPPSRQGAARRSESGIVAGYIHQLSERHEHERRNGRGRRRASSYSFDEEDK